jgi:hypothetical protein
LGKRELQKRKIGESFFGKKHPKIAHAKNFAPKIVPGSVPILSLKEIDLKPFCSDFSPIVKEISLKSFASIFV